MGVRWQRSERRAFWQGCCSLNQNGPVDMTFKLFVGSVLMAIVALLGAVPSGAQVVSDGSLSTQVTTTDGRNFVIQQGDRQSPNLFHSFREFSVPTGGSAWFNNAPDVQNIITRVTGGSVSNIDGLIRANGAANLFLLNPNGIILGRNARLEIGGSFVATSAERLRFADNTEFGIRSASQSAPLLTVSAPVGLQFGAAPGASAIQGNGSQLTPINSLGSIFAPLSLPTGLMVRAGQTLALVGGGVTLSDGNLMALGGRIELGSVGRDAFVGLNPQTGALDYRGVENFQDLRLEGRSLLDASSPSGASSANLGSGTVQLQGRRIQIRDGSLVWVQNRGALPGGDIRIQATDALQISGTDANARVRSGVVNHAVGAGAGGNVQITTRRLQLRDGASIVAETTGAASGGNVVVVATERASLVGFASASPAFSTSIGSFTLGRGSAEDIRVVAPDLRLAEGAVIAGLNLGSGSLGRIAVEATTIRASGMSPTAFPSSISALNFSAGQPGRVDIAAENIALEDGGTFSTSGFNAGDAGDLRVTATGSILITGGRGRVFSSMGSSMVPSTPLANQLIGFSPNPTGDAGSVTIRTPRLVMGDRGNITVRNLGTGDAGTLRVNADTLQLDRQAGFLATTRAGEGSDVIIRSNLLTLNRQSFVDANAAGSGRGGDIRLSVNQLQVTGGSQITAATTGSGEAGNLLVQARESILVSGRANGSPSRLSAASTTDAAAGSVQLQMPDLRITGGAIASVSGAGAAGAGDLNIQADRILLDQEGSLAAEVNSGDRGNINLQARLVELRDRSRITTNATGSASGGDIRLRANFLVGLDNSDIVARAQQGNGGNIQITAQTVLGLLPRPGLTPESDINASSQLGLDGTVAIESPNLELNSGLVELPTDLLDSSSQIADRCAVARMNRFVSTGRGGLPSSPSQLGGSDRPWADLRAGLEQSPSLATETNPNSDSRTDSRINSEMSSGMHSRVSSVHLNRMSNSSTAVFSSGSSLPVPEATAWVTNAAGQVELVAVGDRSSSPSSATCAPNFTSSN